MTEAPIRPGRVYTTGSLNELTTFIDWIRDRTPVARRRQLTAARLSARELTAGARVLPDFLVIGAQRCGTSSLYRYLGQHPQIVPSLRKETDFFATNHQRGEEWYRSHFPLDARLRLSERLGSVRPLTFEASPDYLLFPGAPSRAFDMVPEARLIVLLRDPVERAFSNYLHNRRLGQESLSFEGALDAEAERVGGELSRLAEDPSYQARHLRRYSYVGRGRYAEQLKRWLRVFSDEQLLIVQSRDLFGSPSDTLLGIFDWLGLKAWLPPRYTNYSYGRTGNVVPSVELSPTTRRRLTEVFSEPNRDLARRFGIDFG